MRGFLVLLVKLPLPDWIKKRALIRLLMLKD